MLHADVARFRAGRPLGPLRPAAVPRAIGDFERESVALGAAVGWRRRVAGAMSALAARRGVVTTIDVVGERLLPRLVVALEPARPRAPFAVDLEIDYSISSYSKCCFVSQNQKDGME